MEQNNQLQKAAPVQVLPFAAKNDYAPALKSAEKDIVKAALQPKLGQLMKSENGLIAIGALLSKTLNEIRLRAGFSAADKLEQREVDTAVAYMMDVLKTFAYLSLQEIDQVITNGIRGGYGTFYGLNERTLNEWLVQYTETTRKEAMQKQLMYEQQKQENDPQEQARKERERKEAAQAIRQQALETFAKVKENNKPPYTWQMFPASIDRVNLIYHQLMLKWDEFLGLGPETTGNILMEELRKARAEARLNGGILCRDKNYLKQIALTNARSRVFRTLLARLANEGKDLKTFLTETGAWT